MPRKLNVLPNNPETTSEGRAVGLGRFPSWLHRKLPKGGGLSQTEQAVSSERLHTVCEEAKCPNLLECWSRKTATFLVMGKECTRKCGFCSIDFSKAPKPLEVDEPERVADSVAKLGLKHVVITMVARDDIPDGGAWHLAQIIDKVRQQHPEVTVEVLTTDFLGLTEAWDTVLDARPEVFNYNLETVRRLTPRVRHTATYDRTLKLLAYVKEHRRNSAMRVKSGLMVGLGETTDEVYQAITDLHTAGCDIITIGQYLQSAPGRLLVKEFVHPDQFSEYAKFGHSLGIPHMYCGPFVRSSYNADLFVRK
ncbi:MAG: lipoyl synthase [Chlamydiia bacterium]|nr:lipoyl synthase [Chlamydiia bacterium]